MKALTHQQKDLAESARMLSISPGGDKERAAVIKAVLSLGTDDPAWELVSRDDVPNWCVPERFLK